MEDYRKMEQYQRANEIAPLIAGSALKPSQASRLERCESALRSFVRDFETDFVLDGVIVDNPDGQWTGLSDRYRECKAALEEGK